MAEERITSVVEDNPEEYAAFLENEISRTIEEFGAMTFEPAEEDIKVSAAAMKAVGLEAVAQAVQYKVVDLRGVIPGYAQPNQGSQKKYSGSVIHFNGPATGVASGRVSPVALYAADARYHMQKDWGGGARANGIQYHYGIWGDTLYILRNTNGILWHCGGWPWNGSATAFNIPIGTGERASRATLLTLAAAVEKENRYQGLTNKNTYGHYEVGLPTNCPDTLMNDFVRPMRAGRLNPGPSPTKPDPKPSPSKAIRWINAAYSVRDEESKKYAAAFAKGLQAVDAPAGITPRMTKASKDAKGDGIYTVVFGSDAVETLHREAPEVSVVTKGNVMSAHGDLIHKEGRWRMDYLCDLGGYDDEKALKAYEAALSKA